MNLRNCKRTQAPKWWLFLLLLTTIATATFAQMEVKDVSAPPYNAESLIYNELLGEGVQITNVVYEGTNNSVGFFSNASNSIGLESGVLLTTGSVSTVGANIGVEQVGSVQASVDNGSVVQDADMTTLADFSLFNISKYTITFIPSSDSIRFRYVFASEEYPEFVCSDYNDIFGFFISGPGINGVYENNAENIALIPGTDLPVKINNVNGGVVGDQGTLGNCQNGNGFLDFSEFYNDNDGSNQQPVFDGFLNVFTASAKVIPCSTYTIKLVVADQGDPQRDSGVFLEAKSFSSEFISANVMTESIDGTIIEGCTDAIIEIKIPSPLATDLNLDINVFGEAVEGTDFNDFPNAIIPAGQTTTTINISAIEDGVVEGLESVFFDIQLNQCFRDTFSLLISDNLIPEINLGRDTSVCSGTTLSLNAANLNNNLPPPATFNAENTNVPIISPPPGASPMEASVPLTVAGARPLTLGPDLIQSVCINIDHNRLQDLEIYLQAPDGQLMALSTDNGGTAANYNNTCFTADAVTSIRDGIAPFSGSFLPEGQWDNLWANDSPLNGIWNLVVIDEQFGFNGIITDWSITFNNIARYTYSWENTVGLSCTDCPNPTVSPTVSTDYILNATDNYGCISSDTLSAIIYQDIDTAPTVTCTNQTFDALTFTWDTIPGGLTYEININNTNWTAIAKSETTYEVENLDLNEMVNFAVRATGGCNSMEGSTNCTTLNCTEITLANEDVKNLTCSDAMDGQIQITAMGDNPPFQYDLNGTTNATGLFDGLLVGNYTVMVTDALDCSNNFDYTINAPDALTLIPITIADIGCNGEEGMATVSITGGTAPYTFDWSTGATDSIISSPIGGDFTVNITDANNCEMMGMVTIADKIPMTISVD
ncbi:MAG: choice-of-anchor L domain-containing protein, partial [Saprospiraceae bacterium]